MSGTKLLTLEEAQEIMTRYNGKLLLRNRPDISGLPEGLDDLTYLELINCPAITWLPNL